MTVSRAVAAPIALPPGESSWTINYRSAWHPSATGFRAARRRHVDPVPTVWHGKRSCHYGFTDREVEPGLVRIKGRGRGELLLPASQVRAGEVFRVGAGD